MSMTELRSDWLIGYYALGRDKFCTKNISINNFSSEKVVWEMKAPGNGAPGWGGCSWLLNFLRSLWVVVDGFRWF